MMKAIEVSTSKSGSIKYRADNTPWMSSVIAVERYDAQRKALLDLHDGVAMDVAVAMAVMGLSE